jgi:hypothetical protein
MERDVCTKFWVESHLEDPHIDRMITKMDLREIGWDVAQDRDQWQGLLNMVMDL